MIKWMTSIWVVVAWNNQMIAEIRYAHIIMAVAIILAAVVWRRICSTRA